MRRPCADREEKRVTHRHDRQNKEQEQLEPSSPNSEALDVTLELSNRPG